MDKVVETALKSLEKARKDTMEIVVQAPKGDARKQIEKLVTELQKLEANFQKAAKSL